MDMVDKVESYFESPESYFLLLPRDENIYKKSKLKFYLIHHIHLMYIHNFLYINKKHDFHHQILSSLSLNWNIRWISKTRCHYKDSAMKWRYLFMYFYLTILLLRSVPFRSAYYGSIVMIYLFYLFKLYINT